MRSTLALACAFLAAATAPAAERSYTVVPSESLVTARTGRAGLLKFMGHGHEIVTSAIEGEVVADESDPARSSVTLSFEASALRVTGKGEPADDVAKVQETMVGPKLLDVARHPKVTFRSTAVTGQRLNAGSWSLSVTGDLTIHGTTRRLTIPVHVEQNGLTLTASGSTQIQHTAFAMKPVSVAGVVKVKNEIDLAFRIVARSRQ